MRRSISEKIKKAPRAPGVYIFYAGRTPLYVGKAANLKNRLRSYLKISDFKTEALHEEATRVVYSPLRSDIEALIEESRLIKELKPKYNVLFKDDKSYQYVYFTKDVFPKIFIAHQNSKPYTLVASGSRIGPFTDGGALRLAMKIIRHHFPYCTCRETHFRECLNAQINLCPGACCMKSRVLTRQNISDYQHNIKMIKAILRGQSKKLLKNLKDAAERKALEKIFEHREYLATSHLGLATRVGRKTKNHQTLLASGYTLNPTRIECYDISNFAGKEAVGAMTVLKKVEMRNGKLEWIADKSQWRKFKIKAAPTRDDPRMIAEVLARRLNHPEWPYPDLIIIDGGLTQYNAAKKVLGVKCPMLNVKCPYLISFAKPQQKIIGWENPPAELKKLVQQAIYQTHNFVIRYHRQVRRRALFAII